MEARLGSPMLLSTRQAGYRRIMNVESRIKALTATSNDGGGGVDLLPSRLSEACRQVLGTDGAGVSLFGATTRIPLGASDKDAVHAERLQFTVGDGPCWAAHSSGSAVYADELELARRWPMFHRQLVQETAYRGVASLPLNAGSHIFGALDLYFRDQEAMLNVNWKEVGEAVAVIAGQLARHVGRSDDPDSPPSWMRSPEVLRRTRIWTAVGIITLDLEIDSADALALLRSFSFGSERLIDDVVADIADRVLTPAQLWAGADVG